MLRAKSIHHQRHLIAILDLAGNYSNGEPVGNLQFRCFLGRRSLSQELLESFLKPLLLLQHRFDAPAQMFRPSLEHPRRLGQPVLQFDSVAIGRRTREGDRKSTRLNSSHGYISYAVFCLKKKKKKYNTSSLTSTNPLPS